MGLDDKMMKKCNYCGETIQANSKRCSFCGSILDIGVDEVLFSQQEGTSQNGNGNSEGSAKSAGDSSAAAGAGMGGNYGQAGEERAGNNYQGSIYKNGSHYSFRPPVDNAPLSNALKVFLTTICVLIPGLGQLAGIIIAIVFMNSEENADKKSFGLALLVTSLVIFVVACLLGCIAAVWIRQAAEIYPEFYSR